MKKGKEILCGIMRTTQLGQVKIQCTLNVPISTSLQSVLRAQLKEYDRIEEEARAIASSRGWMVEELDPVTTQLTKATAKLRLILGNTDYKAVSMNIESNTKGLVRGLHALRQFNRSDERIYALSQRLLDCEKANIRQMQGFL